MPVSPSATASSAPPDAAGNLGHACRGGLQEDDAESLAFEAEPSVATDHGEDVGGADEAGQICVGHPAEQPHRRAQLGDPAGQALGVAAAPRNGDGEAGEDGGEPAGGVDEHVHALARDQPADADHERTLEWEAEVRPDPGPFVGAERGEPVDVHSGRDLHHRGHRLPAERTPRFGDRVPAGRDDQRTPADHVGEDRPAHRQAAGDGHLGAVEQNGVGDAQSGTDQTQWERRVEDHEIRADPRAVARIRRTSDGEGTSTLACTRSMRTPRSACSRSKASASGSEEAVSTANEPGSSRRQSSHR